MTFLLPKQIFDLWWACFLSRFFRRNRERKQIQFANTEHTQRYATCKHPNIIIYNSNTEQHIMWITRFKTILGFLSPISISLFWHNFGQNARKMNDKGKVLNCCFLKALRRRVAEHSNSPTGEYARF